jgi:hypothetical protein
LRINANTKHTFSKMQIKADSYGNNAKLGIETREKE